MSVLALALVLLAAPRAQGAADGDTPSRPAPPNVVLVLTDDQGYGDFGFTGNPVLATPHLDALAAAATRVEPFYVHPVCTPTRAALMTSRHPERTRAIDTYIGRAMLAPEEVTLAERFRAAGYATGIFGKWHLGDCAPMRPEDQGFDEALVLRGGGIGQPSDPPGGEGRYTNPVLRDGAELRAIEGYCTDVFFARALDFATRQRAAGRPFFAYVATNAPHGPLEDVPEAWRARYARQDISAVAPDAPGWTDAQRAEARDRTARTYAMVSNIDENVGRFLAGLDALGIAEDTLFVFLADNGPDSARYRVGPDGVTLRGRKSDVYEGGVRSPLLLRWPGVLAAGRVVDAPMQELDLGPTLLAAAGLPAPAGVDGRDLWGVVTGAKADAERVLHVQAHRGDARVARHHFLVRRGPWKLVRASGFGRETPPEAAPFELFDLASDPGERHDLAAERPELVAELLALHDAWFADVSSTREDPWQPPRIWVGGPTAAAVTLTRQDWRHETGRPWGPRSGGRWLLDVQRAGRYRATLRFAEPVQDAGVELVRDGEVEIVTVEPALFASGARRSVDVTLELAAGPLDLRAFAGDGAERAGVHQVELRPDSGAR